MALSLCERNLLEDLYSVGGKSRYKYDRSEPKICNSDILKKDGLLDFDKTSIWLTSNGFNVAKKLLKI